MLVVAPRATVAVAGEVGTCVLDLMLRLSGRENVVLGVVPHEQGRGHRATDQGEGEQDDREPRIRVLIEVADDVLDGLGDRVEETDGVVGGRTRVEQGDARTTAALDTLLPGVESDGPAACQDDRHDHDVADVEQQLSGPHVEVVQLVRHESADDGETHGEAGGRHTHDGPGHETLVPTDELGSPPDAASSIGVPVGGQQVEHQQHSDEEEVHLLCSPQGHITRGDPADNAINYTISCIKYKHIHLKITSVI